jgi:hypothetical protein
VPGGGARRGRRDNGLEAQEYAIVGDVDPRIGEHLLDVLAAGGIAAYLQPATDLHPVTRTTTLPARPTDRLYADREHLGTARDYLTQLTAVPEQHTPPGDGPTQGAGRRGSNSGAGTGTASTSAGGTNGSAPLTDEEVFASIVAGYHVTVDPTKAPWPEAEDVPSSGVATAPQEQPAATDRDIEPAPRAPLRRARDEIDQGSLLDGLDTFGADLPDDPDDDEGYTPPPPPPLPRMSGATALGLFALVGGLIVFFWPTLLPVAQSTAMFVAFCAVLAGFVTLIWRLRPGDEEDDDPDNGARV